MTKRTYVVGAMLIGIGVGLFVAYHNGGGVNTVQKVYVVSKPTELSGLPPHSIHN